MSHNFTTIEVLDINTTAEGTHEAYFIGKLMTPLDDLRFLKPYNGFLAVISDDFVREEARSDGVSGGHHHHRDSLRGVFDALGC